ncbi:MAG: tRNA pseudouridine(55) synthase TruB, partial [Eggerthellaceae bacterium]|nr:tRNA pseudouridine(55) synthase TruB [Eggerthellaceae bacterium]
MKRGSSGLSLVVAVDKPSGMSSHDVVNRCRRIFGEKRVGHTGTLDPLASGVLPICVGPAARLDAYMTNHDKRYVVQVVFGASTDTDDCMGSVLNTGSVPSRLYSEEFATDFVAGLVGKHRQLPPVYSAIKVNGEKACDAARKGRIIDLTPREIEVYDARLVSMEEVRLSLPLSYRVHSDASETSSRSVEDVV